MALRRVDPADPDEFQELVDDAFILMVVLVDDADLIERCRDCGDASDPIKVVVLASPPDFADPISALELGGAVTEPPDLDTPDQLFIVDGDDKISDVVRSNETSDNVRLAVALATAGI
jgi:hypothetical protein